MKIAIVLGTRPEIIKLSPVIRECIKRRYDYFIVHTGQHYSQNMDTIFFKDLALPPPKYRLNLNGNTSLAQLAGMIPQIEDVFLNDMPDLVIVQGDTNSVLAGAIVASRLSLKIAHVEAGLRSYDRAMPEELNRILTDHLSTLFFCPTALQKQILNREGITNHVFVVGNTIVDAVFWAQKNPTKILEISGLTSKDYFLITIHRPENVDKPEKLAALLRYLSGLNGNVILPIHPRTKSRLKEHNLVLPRNIIAIDPPGFLDMITLEKNAKLILTDSGGVQEEACILQVPCITLRTSTERPETLDGGGNMLMSDNCPEDVLKMLRKNIKWKNPFGDVGVSGKILDICLTKT